MWLLVVDVLRTAFGVEDIKGFTDVVQEEVVDSRRGLASLPQSVSDLEQKEVMQQKHQPQLVIAVEQQQSYRQHRKVNRYYISQQSFPIFSRRQLMVHETRLPHHH